MTNKKAVILILSTLIILGAIFAAGWFLPATFPLLAKGIALIIPYLEPITLGAVGLFLFKNATKISNWITSKMHGKEHKETGVNVHVQVYNAPELKHVDEAPTLHVREDARVDGDVPTSSLSKKT